MGEGESGIERLPADQSAETIAVEVNASTANESSGDQAAASSPAVDSILYSKRLQQALLVASGLFIAQFICMVTFANYMYVGRSSKLLFQKVHKDSSKSSIAIESTSDENRS